MNCRENFDELIQSLLDRNVVEFVEDRVRITAQGRDLFTFCCRLIWPLIDGYWTTYIYAYSLLPNKFCEQSLLHEAINDFALKLHDDRIIKFFESCSMETIKNAVQSYLDIGIFEKRKLATISANSKQTHETVICISEQY